MDSFVYCGENSDRYRLMEVLLPYKNIIDKRLSETDYDKNVFIMIKYRDNNKELRKYILESLKKCGYKGVIADSNEWKLTRDSVLNPLAVIYCCKYGLAIFDHPEEYQAYNPNVAYELGIMHYQNKECIIFIQKKISSFKPFDLISKMHKIYENELEVKSAIADWIKSIKNHLKGKKIDDKDKIMVAIVRKDTKFLLTKRKEPENTLLWSFPAKKIHATTVDGIKYLLKECKDETGVTIRPIFKIGERNHPDTRKKVEYWYCEYMSGEIEEIDGNELIDAQWVTGKEAIKKITSDIYEPIKSILNGAK